MHDHGNFGMQTWVKVVSGELTLQRHESNDRRSAMTQETVLAQNSVLFFDDSIGSHRLRNQQPNGVSISLHVYSPPMLGCGRIPAIYCQDSSNSLSDDQRLSIHTKHPNNIIYTNFKSLVDALHGALPPSSSIEASSGLASKKGPDHVTQLLSSMRFNRNEWMQYAKFQVRSAAVVTTSSM